MNYKQSANLHEGKYTNEELYYNQVETLQTLLARNAISQAQYEKNYNDLTEKMGMNKNK